MIKINYKDFQKLLKAWYGSSPSLFNLIWNASRLIFICYFVRDFMTMEVNLLSLYDLQEQLSLQSRTCDFFLHHLRFQVSQHTKTSNWFFFLLHWNIIDCFSYNLPFFSVQSFFFLTISELNFEIKATRRLAGVSNSLCHWREPQKLASGHSGKWN